MNVTSGRTSADVIHIWVYGEIDMATVDDVQQAVNEAVSADGVRDVVVDLAEVTFCDSSGLAAFDEGYCAAASRGIRLRIANPQPGVRRILEIVGLWDTLKAQ
ncbi:STAS domain-containing protein [Actinoplanes sp. NPDC024001]|uniref:STAS domain-containing protein n=1 Tax=Actinoplanes sp. NPDC024001 TaxID=3154598 RepID=UPI0033E56C4D